MEVISINTILDHFVDEIWPTGSHYICSPPVTNTDRDFVILPRMAFENKLDKALLNLGFVCNTKEYYKDTSTKDKFTSYKLGNLNFIVVYEYNVFEKWKLATELAKKLNLTLKIDRVNLFETLFNLVDSVSLKPL